ncbi:MAG TPA: hypothetical protein VEX60_01655 [Pyrinomonadaceae bacterium]|nr:hypothetical protein [Pyrinomonadaceae bacterium]
MIKRGAEFKPYTIVWQGTEYDENGAVVGQYTETRYTTRDGRWYSVRRFPDGRRQEYFSVPGKGVFVRGKERLLFLSEARGAPPTASEEEARTSPFFLRSEEVLGLQAFVFKTGPGGRDEMYRAPALNYDAIKIVERHDSGALRSTTEVVSVVAGDPDPSVFKPVNLPVDSSFYEQKQKMIQK